MLEHVARRYLGPRAEGALVAATEPRGGHTSDSGGADPGGPRDV